MINVLHLYYDLLNLYGENANTRCIEHTLKLNNVKTNIDYKSINEEIDFDKYDLIYISQGSEENLLIALNDIKRHKKGLNKFIEDNKYLILTGNAMDLFGKYIEINDEKHTALDIFNYNTKFITKSNFENASVDRIVGQVYGDTKLIDKKIIGFQNRCDLNHNVKTPLFKLDEKFSNDLTNKNEGFTYKNVYATHIIGPLLIRNPFFTDYILSKLCKDKKIKYDKLDEISIKAYEKYLSNFY